MNSFCNTVYVIVMLLRRREAGERGKWKRAGYDGKGETGGEAFSHFQLSTARLIFFLLLLLFLFEYPVGVSTEERGDRGFPNVIAAWIYSYNLY